VRPIGARPGARLACLLDNPRALSPQCRDALANQGPFDEEPEMREFRLAPLARPSPLVRVVGEGRLTVPIDDGQGQAAAMGHSVLGRVPHRMSAR